MEQAPALIMKDRSGRLSRRALFSGLATGGLVARQARAAGTSMPPPVATPKGALSNRLTWRPHRASGSITGGGSGQTICELIHLEAPFSAVCLEFPQSRFGGAVTYSNIWVSPSSAYNDGVTPLDMTGAVNHSFWRQVTFNNGGLYVDQTSQRAVKPTSASVVSGGTGYSNGSNLPFWVGGCAGGIAPILLCTVSGGVVTAITGIEASTGNNNYYIPPNPVTLIPMAGSGSGATANLTPNQATSLAIPAFSWAPNETSYASVMQQLYFSDFIPCGGEQGGFQARDGNQGAYLLVRMATGASAAAVTMQTDAYLTSPSIAAAGSGYLGGGSGQLIFPVNVQAGTGKTRPFITVNITSGVPTSIGSIVSGGDLTGYTYEATFSGASTTSASITGSISGTTLTVSAISAGLISPGLYVQGVTGTPQITGPTGQTGVGTYTLSSASSASSGALTLSVDPAGSGLTINGTASINDGQKKYVNGVSPTTARRSFSGRYGAGQYVGTSGSSGLTGAPLAGMGFLSGVIGLGRSRGHVVLEVSDSTQMGTGSDAGVNTAAQLACTAQSSPLRPVSLVNFAWASSASETFVERWLQVVAAYRPTIVIQQLCTPNDNVDGLYTTTSTDDGLRNTWTIIQWCLDNNIPLILQGPNPQPSKLSSTQWGYNLAVRQTMQMMHAAGFGLYWDWPNIIGDSSAVQSFQNWVNSPDWVHPGQAGQIALAFGQTAVGQAIPSAYPLSVSVTPAGGSAVTVPVQPLSTILQQLVGAPGVYQ